MPVRACVRQIAAKARAAGRIEWVEVVAGGKQGRRLGSMTDGEWNAALSVLQANRRWPDAWRLAQERRRAEARFFCASLRVPDGSQAQATGTISPG